MKVLQILCAAIAAAMLASSCVGVPAKRVGTVVYQAGDGGLDAMLSEVSVSATLSQDDIARVAREVFPLAARRAGIPLAEGAGRAEYDLWLREDEYTIGIDTYSAVLCVVKLRSKPDGALIASTILSDETKLSLRSSGYVYRLLREALASLRGAVSASGRAAKAAEK